METKTSERDGGPQEVFGRSVYSPPDLSGPAWVAASEKGGITIYRADRSDIRATLVPSKKEGVVSLAWSPIAHRGNVVLASGSKDGEVCLWTFGLNESRAPVVCRVIHKGRDAISSIAFSRDGKTLAVGTHSGSIMVWNVHTVSPALVCTLTFATSGPESVGGSRVSSLAFSPTQTDVLVSGDASGNLVRWTGVDDSCLKVASEHVYECGDEVMCTAWSPSGSVLAVGLGSSKQEVLVLSLPAARTDSEGVRREAGRLTGVSLLSEKTASVSLELKPGARPAVASVCHPPTTSPEGTSCRLLVTIPKSVGASDPFVPRCTGHTSAVTDVSFRDEETLVSAAMDCQVIVSRLVLVSDDKDNTIIKRTNTLFSEYGAGRFARLNNWELLATGSSLPCIRVFVGGLIFK